MKLGQASASWDTRPFHQSLEMTAWHSGFSLTWLQGVSSILLQQTASFPRPCTGKPGNALLGDICMPCQHTPRMTEIIFHQPKHCSSQRGTAFPLLGWGGWMLSVTLVLPSSRFTGPHPSEFIYGKPALCGLFSVGGHKPKDKKATVYTLVLNSELFQKKN